MRSTRKLAAMTAATAAALILAACGGGSSGSGSGTSTGSSASGGPVTLSWWNNATADPLKGIYLEVIKNFHAAHPKVSTTNVPIQNEQFTTKIPLALQSSDPPDIFQQWAAARRPPS